MFFDGISEQFLPRIDYAIKLIKHKGQILRHVLILNWLDEFLLIKALHITILMWEWQCFAPLFIIAFPLYNLTAKTGTWSEKSMPFVVMLVFSLVMIQTSSTDRRFLHIAYIFLIKRWKKKKTQTKYELKKLLFFFYFYEQILCIKSSVMELSFFFSTLHCVPIVHYGRQYIRYSQRSSHFLYCFQRV